MIVRSFQQYITLPTVTYRLQGLDESTDKPPDTSLRLFSPTAFTSQWKPWPVLVVFRNGYSKDSPEVVCKCTLQFGKGKPEWGAEPGKLYYVLKIEKVEEVRNHVLLG